MNPNMPSSGRVDVLLSALGVGRFDSPARINDVIYSLKFDEALNGNKPERCTLDFQHAIEILEAQVAALVEARAAVAEVYAQRDALASQLAELVEACKQEHGGEYSHPECPICVALALTEPQS